MDNTFEWAARLGYLCTNESYPYVSGHTREKGVCVQQTCDKIYNVTTALASISSKSDAALMSMIAKHPVSVTVDSYSVEFQFVSYLSVTLPYAYIFCWGLCYDCAVIVKYSSVRVYLLPRVVLY